jgi:2,3-bisphosphoglycerate-independent phosphoglycerate mutase
MNIPKPIVLLILDGWGIGPANAGNAITRANTPNMRKYWVAYPHTQLTASGEAVGLPHGEDGNTETGHLNIGAGKIVYQDLPRINMSIADGTFGTNRVFLEAFEHVKRNNSALHLMGLVGSGGVHSNIDHLYALISAAKASGLTNVFLHLFTDGRDSPPTSAISFITQIQEHCKSQGVGRIATIIGRYYSMDRDHRWDRIQLAYDALTLGSPSCTTDPIAAVQERYNAGETDEFIKPISICDLDGKPKVISDNDGVIFFNFRIDRPRELTKAFVLPNFESGISSEGFDPYTVKYHHTHLQPQPAATQTFVRQKILKNLYFVSMTEYERGLPTNIAYPPQTVEMPLGRVLEQRGIKQLRMSETEKERFVTYYFNGLREDSFTGEDHVIIPSKKVATYDTAPEMSAREITQTFLEKLNGDFYDFICINLANADMVGHTGNLTATMQAVEIVDECVGKIVNAVTIRGGVVLITADHGNAEELINNETGEIDTEHSGYPVPLYIIGNQFQNKSTMLPSGILADIGPTILKLMDIPKPDSMTGRALI